MSANIRVVFNCLMRLHTLLSRDTLYSFIYYSLCVTGRPCDVHVSKQKIRLNFEMERAVCFRQYPIEAANAMRQREQ